jgi:transketolase
VSPTTKRFLRHYAEMVAAMFLGMAVLSLPAEWAMNVFGTGWSEIGDAAMFLLMATTMTIPMVGWMAYRGHGWRPNAEMAASMYLPAFAVAGLTSAGIGDTGGLMVLEHVAMLLSMLGAMLLRPAEYTSHAGHGHRHAEALDGQVAA